MRWMHRSVVWTVVLCLAGVGASFLPWLRLTIDGIPSAITGLDVWQGEVAAALFGILGLFEFGTALLKAAPRWRPFYPIATGILIAAVAGLYVAQFAFEKLTRIEIDEKAAIAAAFEARNRNDLSVGAPMTMALGLALVVQGIVMLCQRLRNASGE